MVVMGTTRAGSDGDADADADAGAIAGADAGAVADTDTGAGAGAGPGSARDVTPVPALTADVTEAGRRLRTEGAVVLTGRAMSRATTAADLVATAEAMFVGEIVELAPPEPFPGPGPPDATSAGATARTDGPDPADPDTVPDYVLMGAALTGRVLTGRSLTGGAGVDGGPGSAGGVGSGPSWYLVDGYAVLDALRSSGPDDVVQRLVDTAVEHGAPGGSRPWRGSRSVAPLIGTTDRGRPMLRRFPDQRPRDGSPHPDADAAMVEAWACAIADATATAPRFRLAAGDVLVIDNYRMFHGHEGDQEPGHELDPVGPTWRLRVWTTAALGSPRTRERPDPLIPLIP